MASNHIGQRRSGHPPRSKGLFFDLDGTLANSERFHWQAWRSILQPLRVPFTWAWYAKNGIGRHDAAIVEALLPRLPIGKVRPQTLLNKKHREFIRIVRKRSPIPVATQRLLCEVSDIPLAVVTSCKRAEALALLRGSNLVRCFRVVVCLEDVRRPKPDPAAYLAAMRKLRVTEGIAFEDSPAGLASARAAGLHTVHVRDPRHLPRLIRHAMAGFGNRNANG